MLVLPAKWQENICTGRYSKELRNENREHLCESNNFETQKSSLYIQLKIKWTATELQEIDAFGKEYHLWMHACCVSESFQNSFYWEHLWMNELKVYISLKGNKSACFTN